MGEAFTDVMLMLNNNGDSTSESLCERVVFAGGRK